MPAPDASTSPARVVQLEQQLSRAKQHETACGELEREWQAIEAMRQRGECTCVLQRERPGEAATSAFGRSMRISVGHPIIPMRFFLRGGR